MEAGDWRLGIGGWGAGAGTRSFRGEWVVQGAAADGREDCSKGGDGERSLALGEVCEGGWYVKRGVGREVQCFCVTYWVDITHGIAGFKVDMVYPVRAWVEALHACTRSCVLDGCLGLWGQLRYRVRIPRRRRLLEPWLAVRALLSLRRIFWW
jgi:hypothetical protein